ncbi:MAG: YceI family protein [Proteobacteria bacterium]|nr:YceI family protein [Pseudomonadota bacterium]
MNKTYRSVKWILSFGLSTLLSAGVAAADESWRLNKDTSELVIASTKNSQITERHNLSFQSGAITKQGVARLVVDLLSIETNIPIRNERMRKYLFDNQPQAIIEMSLTPSELQQLMAGQSSAVTLPAAVTANGTKLSVPVAVRTNSDGGGVVVSGETQIDVAKFGYGPGIEQLRVIAGLAAISTTVPVSFRLQFDR